MTSQKNTQKSTRRTSTKIIPIGGIEEFGNNCLLIEYADSMIIIDFGLKFQREPSYGIDFLIPDMRYLKSNEKKIKALFCTHGHLDHIGGIRFLSEELNIPIYASKFTSLLIHQLFLSTHNENYDLRVMNVGNKITIGPFIIEPVPIDHSIPEAYSLVIETPTGLLVHSGDFRNDREPFKRKRNMLEGFDKYHNKNVLALFSDSTNAVKAGRSTSEMVVYRNLEKIFKQHSERLVFSTFSTQIDRIRKVLDLALKYNRVVFLVGKSMLTNLGIAVKGQLLQKYEKILRPLKDYKKYPPSQSVLVATGSQGEENSALIKLATKQHRQIRLDAHDVIVLSSSVIPGNEVAVSDLLNSLLKSGHKVITNADMPIHTSGHGYADELTLLIEKVNPKFFFPIHGNYMNLIKHKELALKQGMRKEDVFIIENGQKLEIFNNHVKLLEKIRIQPLYIEGGRISISDDQTLLHRKKLSEGGVVFVMVYWGDNQIEDIVIEGSGVSNAHSEQATWSLLKVELRKNFAAKVVNKDFKNKKRIEKFLTLEIKKFLHTKLGVTPLVRAAVYAKHL